MNKSVLIVIFLVIVFVQAVGAESVNSLHFDKESLRIGESCLLSVFGTPNTYYYIWVTGTRNEGQATAGMTGAPCDQPPFIQSSSNVIQDPPNGPFTIGSFLFDHEGYYRSIIQDVPPTTDSLSNINYYAKILTDSSGLALITIKTTPQTRSNTYRFRVENYNSTTGLHAFRETAIDVGKGSVTAKTDRRRSCYPLTKTKIFGTNTASSKTYLSIIGGGGGTSGVKPSDSSKTTVNCDSTTFDSVDVKSDNTWEYLWDPSNFNSEPQYVTFRASSQPDYFSPSASVPVADSRKWILVSVIPPIATQGDKITISGQTVGLPIGVQVWIFGPNYLGPGQNAPLIAPIAPTLRTDFSQYEITLSPIQTQSLPAGQYYVVAQHPMQDQKFDSYYDPSTRQITSQTNKQPIFSIDGPNSLQGAEAANALYYTSTSNDCSQMTTFSISASSQSSATPTPTITTTSVTTATSTTAGTTIQPTDPTTSTTTPFTTSISTPTSSRTPTSKVTLKTFTPYPTDTPTQPTPLGAEIGIIATIGAAFLVMKRK